jgi:hypothetical protein
MAHFNFKAELDSAKNDVRSKKIETGFYRVIITQVAEIGYQKAFNPEDEPQLKVGVVFENAVGQQICKIMPLKINSYLLKWRGMVIGLRLLVSTHWMME